jgi:hypothetical protein
VCGCRFLNENKSLYLFDLQALRLEKLQKKDKYTKEDGSPMSLEEIEAIKAAKYEAAGGKDAFKAKRMVEKKKEAEEKAVRYFVFLVGCLTSCHEACGRTIALARVLK